MALTDKLTNIADAIREKTGSTRTMNLEEMAATITNIKIPTALSDLNEDETHRTVTDAEKETWNNKSNFSGNYDDLKNKPTLSLGFGTDGKLYIMVSGVPIGNGVEINGTIDPSDGVVVFSADFSGSSPSATQFYSWEGRVYDNSVYDALSNIKCTDGVAKLTSVYDSDNSRWIKQMMCTGGMFESDNFICSFRAKFSGLAGSWNNVITYGTGTHWTNGLYSDGVKWPAGGEIDAFEQAGVYAETPNTFRLATHWGSGTNSGYPNMHERRSTAAVEFTTDEWHDFKFSLKNGYAQVWVDEVLVGENDFSDCSVSNNYLMDYKPFLKPQAFYIDGSCASKSATSNIYEFEISDFKITQDANVECTGLEIYPQMWPQGTELIFPVGAELYLDRVYTPENTSNKACTWVSSNPTVATVVQGHVNVIGIGTATITAKCGNATAQYVLTSAENSNIPCVKLSLTQTAISLVSGDTYDLSNILYKYPNFTTESVSFTTGSETVEVSDAGIVTAINEGNGTISVSCGVNTLEVSITVSAPNTPLIDNTFDNVDKAIGAVSDTLIGGFTAGQTYTAIWVVMPNPKYTSGARIFSSCFYKNKAPGIQVDSSTLQLIGRESIHYNIDLGTAADGIEIRAVFTVGGITKFYVDGELKYTGTSNVDSSNYPVGTDTWFTNGAVSDQQYTLRRAALYAGEYLGTF